MIIAVVIPAYNEAERIGDVISRIPRRILLDNRVRVIVIDDGSTDDTSGAALRAGADVVRKHPVNRGVGHAFITGVKAAASIGSNIIVQIDADGQLDPDEIPKLVKPIIEKRADLVLGSRFLGPDADDIPRLKRMGNRIITFIVSLICAQRFTDTQCGFRAMTGQAAQRLTISGLFTYTQEAIISAAGQKLHILEQPISVRYFNNRVSRVVRSIPKYAAKVIGLFMIGIMRMHGKRVLAIILLILAVSSLSIIVSQVL